MNRIEKMVDNYIKKEGGYWNVEYMLIALVEEVGELAREILRYKNIKKGIPRVEEEIGDILFATVCISNFFGINIEKAVLKTIEKYRERL